MTDTPEFDFRFIFGLCGLKANRTETDVILKSCKPNRSVRFGSKTEPIPTLVPFLKEPGTCLKNRFCVFLDTQMSGYNLSSILEQVTTGFRVPKNGEPIRVPDS
jgi:hypothetical protein